MGFTPSSFGFNAPVKIHVFVTPKKNVLDPQGAAVGHALESLGFQGLKNVRVGKLIELEAASPTLPIFGPASTRCAGTC